MAESFVVLNAVFELMLAAGTKLGSYEIRLPIGAGGMGEVYRARDTKLGREVALKVLPQAFASDPQRRARFTREAQVLASLNHPYIAAIYGFEDSGDHPVLVMELVEGLTLADRLKSSATALDEALSIAQKIAEGLEYAREKGVIHRDLKPANVKITPEGTVKVLDFGLAKAADASAPSGDPSTSPTLTAQATQAGMIMGTAAYMAPEQARGHAVDRRADIWSFGVVLFEMLTGQRAFAGETTSDVLASVLKFDPDWSELPASTPPSIIRLLHRCLTKDRKQRLQAIGEARIAIEETLGRAEAGTELMATQGPQVVPLPRGRRALPWLVAAGLALIAGVAGWWAGARRNPPAPNWSAQVLGGPSLAMGPRISPDGHTLAFQAMVDGLNQVAVMDTESSDWTVLTKDRSHGYLTELNWSPDGSETYFDRSFSVPLGVYTVSRFGGNERLILEDANGPEPLPDGSLLLIRLNKDRNFQLYRFWPESGRLDALDALTVGSDLCPPVRAFHDGKDAVFIGKTLEQDKADTAAHLYAIDLASGKARRLAPGFDFRLNSSLNIFPMAMTSDDQSVLVETAAGDLYQILSVPRRGTSPIRTLFSLTFSPDMMDVDKDGNIYLDQPDRPMEVLRSSASGGTPDVLVGPERATQGQYETLQSSDGRLVLDSMVAGRSRLLAAKPGGEAVPFIRTKEETSSPFCRVGENEFAFL